MSSLQNQQAGKSLAPGSRDRQTDPKVFNQREPQGKILGAVLGVHVGRNGVLSLFSRGLAGVSGRSPTGVRDRSSSAAVIVAILFSHQLTGNRKPIETRRI